MIVDSNIWIEYLRAPAGSIGRMLDALLDDDAAALVGIVLAEVLEGARTDENFDRIESALRVAPYVEITRRAWRRAGEIAMHLRRQGRPLPLTDLAIAAAAMEGDHEVFTLDKHFQRIPGLRLFDPKGAAGA